MRLVFAGTPGAALPSLRAVASSHDVCAVITRQDAPQGRKRILTPSPVAEQASVLGLDVIKTNQLTATVGDRIAAFQPDLGVIVAYGSLVREPVLSLPRFGWVNLHFSLLPRWRGAAPVQHSLIAGDRESGAVVFQLTPGLDDGDIIAEVRRGIEPDVTAGELLAELSVVGAELLTRAIAEIGRGATPRPQTGEPSYAPKLTSADGRLEGTHTLTEVYGRFRGVTPEPGAWILVGDTRLKIQGARPGDDRHVVPGEFSSDGQRVFWGVADGSLELLSVQPAGKREMSAISWWRGALRGGQPS